MKSWIRKVVLEEEEEDYGKKTESKPSLAEEAAAAAKSAAAAAADVARASQDMLISKTEGQSITTFNILSLYGLFVFFYIGSLSMSMRKTFITDDPFFFVLSQRRDTLGNF